MMVDDREIPLDEFETTVLNDLLSAQARRQSEASPGGQVVAFARRPTQSRRKPVLVGAAAAIAGSAIAVGITLPSGSKTAAASPVLLAPLPFAAGTHAAAVEFLASAASAAEAQPTEPGPVIYTRTQNYDLSTDVSSGKSRTDVTTTIRDVWEGADGSTLVRERTQLIDRTGADVGPPGAFDHNGTYQPGGWADLNRGFPITSGGVRSQLTAQYAATVGGFSQNIIIGNLIGLHLETGTATSQQSAALYRTLAGLSGVFDAGPITDAQGRVGEAVGIVVSGPGSPATGTDYFVISHTTGQTLDVEEVDNRPPSALHLPPKPVVAQYAAILTTARVSAVGVTPGHS